MIDPKPTTPQTMQIKMPNCIIIEDATDELVRSILGASFSPVVTVAEANPSPTKQPEEVEEPAPAAPKKKMHPFNRKAVASPDFDPLPAIVKTITGRHHIAKKEAFLVLRELNTCGRALAPREIASRLRRYEVFATLKDAAVHHSLYRLVQYGAIVHRADSTYIIAPEVIGESDEDLLGVINEHDTPDEWARLKQ